jgi:hypothetical protein
MIKKIIYFINLDIRKKLIVISKYTKINFYPTYISNKGLARVYAKILFNFFLLSDFLKYKKRLYKKIFKSRDKSNFKKNFLVSTPSSGSTFIRLMLQSYFELLYKVGNGIPKYDNINNRMMFAASQIETADLWNEIRIHNALIDNEKFIESKDFERKKFVFTRFPMEKMNLYKIEEMKPVVVFRDPYEVILSTYIKKDRRDNDIKQKNVNFEILNERIAAHKKYIFFWYNYFKNKKHKLDFLMLDYAKLINDTQNEFKKILDFYEYEINVDFIEKCSNIHSEENTKNLFKGFKIYNRIRFTDAELKKNQKKIIYTILDNNLEVSEIVKIYKSIIEKHIV